MNAQIKDGTTIIWDVDLLTSGPHTFAFDPPLQFSPNTQPHAVLTAGGAGVVGKANLHAFMEQ